MSDEPILGEHILSDAAFRSKVSILLDANLYQLRPALKSAGFKVVVLKPDLSDEEIGDLAEGMVILTKNSTDFVENAVAGDFDVINVDRLKFIDPDPTLKNKTVAFIKRALKESQLYLKRGNFELVLYENGKWDLKVLVI